MANPTPRRQPDRPSTGASPSPDVAVVGTGIIGLCTALALADRELSVLLIGEPHPGEASPAAAGILGASLEDTHSPDTPEAVHRFAVAARDRYVTFLPDLVDRSGVSIPFNRLGILEVALDDAGAAELRHGRVGEWVDGPRLTALEPSLERAVGGLFYEADGAVDNVAMLRALRHAIDCTAGITRITASVVSLTAGATGVVCTTAGGETYETPRAVLSAGAWSAGIRGLPRSLPVEPLRGQMLAVAAPAKLRPRHVIYGPHAYIVPRGERIIVGATLEHVGFDPSTTPAALAELHAGGAEILPAIAAGPVLSSWAGLRPATPDLLPVLGPDPVYPSLIYACGHSRNGILMAPLTADCVAALVVDETPAVDVTPFAVDRFALPVPSVTTSR